MQIRRGWCVVERRGLDWQTWHVWEGDVKRELVRQIRNGATIYGWARLV